MQNENAVKTFRYVCTHFPLSFPSLKSHFQLYSHNKKYEKMENFVESR